MTVQNDGVKSDSYYGDLVISGIGRSSGGKFGRASIDGKGTVDGDVECDSWSCNGISAVNGNMKAKKAIVNGVSTFSGDVHADHIQLSGKVRIGHNLTGEHIQLDGVVKIDGDCEAEQLTLNGGVKIGGTINAERVEIRMFATCSAREIGGSAIRVTRQPIGLLRQWFGELIPSFIPRLSTSLIEGDDIRLAHTTADFVRGNRVQIGPGCEIGHIEYRDDCIIDPHAKVIKSEKKG